MKLLAEINEQQLGIGKVDQFGADYKLRKSARAIISNSEGKIALQHLRNYDFYKLPGGGIEQGESIEQAAKREVLEETGCDCQLGEMLGVVIEYRNQTQLIQISYCCQAKLVGKIGEPKLEDTEKYEENQNTVWVDPKKALKLLNQSKPQKLSGHYILAREKVFLKEYLEKIKLTKLNHFYDKITIDN